LAKEKPSRRGDGAGNEYRRSNQHKSGEFFHLSLTVAGRERLPHDDRLQLRRAISIQAELKRLLEKHA
jgi:hypothetical protein